MKKPAVLMIMDGWGNDPEGTPQTSAVAAAHKPNFDSLMNKYPNTELLCSGEEVGLPVGQMGNSEVGHLNIGAGRIVYQELTRINKSIKDGDFFTNPVLLGAIREAKKENKPLQIMGLVSDGGVHSHQEHLYALLDLAKKEGVEELYVHAFLDGRDVLPDNALEYLLPLAEKLQSFPRAGIATISGRYYAMDRDKRWERVEKAYLALTEGEGVRVKNPAEAIKLSYEQGNNDEFLLPTVLENEQGEPLSVISPEDPLIFFNFRADRARQLTRAFTEEDFSGFIRKEKPKNRFVCMTLYDKDIEAEVAFMPQDLRNTLGEVLAKEGLKQLRIAETEKYAHVTFFFNGGVEKPNPGEERILIPSPKVATYDLQPEMSAREVTRRVKEELLSRKFDFILINFANADMVGHTGFLPAATKAIETVDSCLGEVAETVLGLGGTLLVTADHGNAEMMVDKKTGEVLTSHSWNPVPLLAIGGDCESFSLRPGSLQDLAPTVLKLLKIEKPAEMTGESLLVAKGRD